MASLSWLLWNQIMIFGGAIKRRHLWEDMQERYVSVERSVSCREERGLLLERKVLFRWGFFHERRGLQRSFGEKSFCLVIEGRGERERENREV